MRDPFREKGRKNRKRAPLNSHRLSYPKPPSQLTRPSERVFLVFPCFWDQTCHHESVPFFAVSVHDSDMTNSRFVTSMRRESLRAFFDASPTAKLLRSDYAPIVIDFLFRHFKSGEAISLGQSDLRARLSLYQEELHETDPELLTGSPERYLTQWVDAGWLSRFLEAASLEPQYQLTRYAEEAIRFVDSALTRSGQMLVGTESRLRMVIETLEDIVRGSSADPNRRLEYLRSQRAIIDAEIESIESGKSVQVYRPSQIRERFQTAVDLLKALQSDFRAVEERFQVIAREVQRLQSAGHDTRGGILGYALDSEDLLKQQDEGISFFAFVTFLFSPTQQAALRKNIEEVQQLAALADQQESIQRVRRMVPSLLAEADKVMKTTARLSGTLRRLLDAQAAAHRVRLANVLQDIKQSALKLRNNPPKDIDLQVFTDAEIVSPMARTFWTPPTTFTQEAPSEFVMDLSQSTQLAEAFSKLHRLDFNKLRKAIREQTFSGEMITLGELIGKSSMSCGVVELLGWMQIAHDDGHRVEADCTESIVLKPSDRNHRSLRVVVPKITFVPKASSSSSGRKPK